MGVAEESAGEKIEIIVLEQPLKKIINFKLEDLNLIFLHRQIIARWP